MSDLRHGLVRSPSQAAQGAQPARCAHRRHEFSACLLPCHTRLHDGMLNPEQITESRMDQDETLLSRRTLDRPPRAPGPGWTRQWSRLARSVPALLFVYALPRRTPPHSADRRAPSAATGNRVNHLGHECSTGSPTTRARSEDTLHSTLAVIPPPVQTRRDGANCACFGPCRRSTVVRAGGALAPPASVVVAGGRSRTHVLGESLYRGNAGAPRPVFATDVRGGLC